MLNTLHIAFSSFLPFIHFALYFVFHFVIIILEEKRAFFLAFLCYVALETHLCISSYSAIFIMRSFVPSTHLSPPVSSRNLFQNMTLPRFAFFHISREAISFFSLYSLKLLSISVPSFSVYVTKLRVVYLYRSLSFLHFSLPTLKMFSLREIHLLSVMPCLLNLLISNHKFDFQHYIVTSSKGRGSVVYMANFLSLFCEHQNKYRRLVSIQYSSILFNIPV